jgi:two-component system C4-dicarboxylate transport response regulator DctD
MPEGNTADAPVVLVIDDDEAARLSIAQMLRLRGFKVEAFSSAEKALSSLENAKCIITDIKMPGMDGEQLLAEATRLGLLTPILVITGHGDIPMAVRCLKAGAFDFLEKPFDDDVLLAYVTKAIEQMELRVESRELRRRLSLLSPEENGRFSMVGRSREMQDMYELIEVAAQNDSPVLIMGETGSGKELVARAIHAQSARCQAPFVPVNAGALPDNLLESELFGHARGSFTGATTEREGKLVCASGGTLLLDEIETMSERAQVQLLRVLDDGIVEPLGSNKPRKVDIRLVSASNVNLQQEVSRGTIREDFFHRIMVLSIVVPPLRDRQEDIPLLLSHFLRLRADQIGLPVPQIPEKVVAKLLAYSWPGNVRELKNTVERMLITSHDGVAGDFEPDLDFESGRLLSMPAAPGLLREEMERTEKTVIETALRTNRGQINPTYQSLGISRRALYERMKKYGLERGKYR